MAISIDWRALAEQLKKDRSTRRQNQTGYAKDLGLTQPQVSKLETGKMSELSVQVRDALVNRFGKLPHLQPGPRMHAPAAPPPIPKPKADWQKEGVRDHRAFTALVEALRLVDAKGSDKDWRAAWATIRGAFLVLKTLSGFEERHWRRIFGEEGTRAPLDHWKTLAEKPEEEAGRRGLHSQLKGGTDR